MYTKYWNFGNCSVQDEKIQFSHRFHGLMLHKILKPFLIRVISG